MKFARIVNGFAVDVFDTDPTDRFHPDVAAQFVQVDDSAQNNWIQLEDGTFADPATLTGPTGPA